MQLQTLSYAPEPSDEMVDPLIGLPDLRKGLNTILLGYLLMIGSIVGAGAAELSDPVQLTIEPSE